MTEATAPDRASRILCIVYGLIAIAALIATWSQNLAFFALPDNGGVLGFLRACFVNPAAAAVTIDICMVFLAASVWMVVEARRLGMRHVWVYIVLSLLVALSVMFPLFLLMRERRLGACRRMPC